MLIYDRSRLQSVMIAIMKNLDSSIKVGSAQDSPTRLCNHTRSMPIFSHSERHEGISPKVQISLVPGHARRMLPINLCLVGFFLPS